MKRLLGTVDIRTLFPEKPTLSFYPETSTCCEFPLTVQKTRTRKRATTTDIGTFVAKETVLVCKQCDSTYPSQALQKLIPAWCNFGYDVMVYVGISLFLNYRNEKEIQEKLAEKNIIISRSEITYLAKRFIACLAIAHKESGSRIKQVLNQRGGYILHIDAMCDGDSPHLMSGLDEISEIVLDNVKLPTEKAEKIIPFLKRIKTSFGKPLALVHDMGKGILSAVKEVFKDVPDFICHFHFLRDSGKDLFGKENDLIRNRLRFHGIQGRLRKEALRLKKKIEKHPEIVDTLITSLEEGTIQESAFEHTPLMTVYTLIQWALDGKNQGQGYGFPFDRPYLTFYQRLQEIYRHCGRLQNVYLPDDKAKDNKLFYKICALLRDMVNDEELHTAVTQIQEKIFVFDKLRDAMKIADTEQKHGLNDDGGNDDIKTIEQRVKKFRAWLIQDDRYKGSKDYRKMVGQIDKYWEKLFADPIHVNTPQGKVTIQPQRTNNILERFFRNIRYGYRKKSGNNTMSKTLKAMLAQTPLVKNLQNPEYLKIILNGKKTLEERFAEIDSKTVRKEMKKSQEDSEKVPSKIKAIIKKPELPEILVNLFASQMKI
jgi:hypothetical protein